MEGVFKVLSAVAAVVCSVVFILIYFVSYTVPQNVTTVENASYRLPQIFGINIFNIKIENEVNVIRNNNEPIEQDAQIELFNIIPVKNINITNSKRKYVVPGGEIFGIKLYTDGVIVVDTDYVETENGNISPAEISGLKIGDIIKEIDNVTIQSTKHLTSVLEKSQGKEITITVLRNNKELKINFKTYKDLTSNKYKAGLWVRDSTAGLGTVTFYNPENNSFAGLGHPIYDIDTNEIMPMKNGEMAQVKISGLYKSSQGVVGELCGILTGKATGELCLNCETGIYGFTKTIKKDEIPVAVSHEISKGKAQIICTIDNSGPKYYDIEIVKINAKSTVENKDMVIKIVDNNLISKTGGIVQGMSGSPIIQNGKLIGAVTHVFVNDTLQGYGIFAERMYQQSVAREMEKHIQLQAS